MEIQTFLKRVRFEFYLYSVVALVTSLVVTGVLYSYHADLIEQQNSLQQVNQLLTKQMESVVVISDIAEGAEEINNKGALAKLQKRMHAELNSLKNEHALFTSAVQRIENKKIGEEIVGLLRDENLEEKIEIFLKRYQKMEALELENVKEFQVGLSTISNMAYRELFKAFTKASDFARLGQSTYQDRIKNIGNYLILFIVFVIVMFWGLLFHPIYKKLIIQYEKKNQALVNAQIATRAKNDFLANINHEIRTPMTTILGYVELLSVEGLLGADEQSRAYQTINTNANHLLKLIDEILDLSKLEIGEFNVNTEKVDPKKVLSDLYNIMRFKTDKKNIDLKFNFKTPIPDKVLSDSKRIKQALFNVLNNAVKFTVEGGVEMDIYFDKDQCTLTFIIKDSGLGINDKAKSEIFKIFSQENTNYNRNYSGTGLGLALTKKILNELGGDIKLDYSEKNKGSVFSLWFKVKDLETFNSLDTEVNVEDHKKLVGKRLLVVDDAVENSRIFQKYLLGAGSEVDVANSGHEALEMVGNNTYDLVLLDIQMPELDGYQVLRRLREDTMFEQPVIALTAHAMEEQKRENLKFGFDGHISKPISSQSLIQSVSSYF
ncbi:MAG: response regulator [Bacteriovoracaceae bacterium]|nr:response regulator [Bacteriovoracaceae bacterium]